MKAKAIAALQSVRTRLACQLTPEYVSELLEPIQNYVMESIHIADPGSPSLEDARIAIELITRGQQKDFATHNAKVEEALEASYRCCRAHHDGSGFNDLFDAVDEAIRSLRL